MINGIFLCILFVVLLIVVMVSFSGRPPSVAEGPTLMLDLGGEIAERNPVNVPAVFLQRGMKPTLKDFHDMLQKAAVDKRVDGIVLKPGGLAAGWGKAHPEASVDPLSLVMRVQPGWWWVAGS